MTDIHTLGHLREQSDDDIMEDITPFGFVDNGGVEEMSLIERMEAHFAGRPMSYS